VVAGDCRVSWQGCPGETGRGARARRGSSPEAFTPRHALRRREDLASDASTPGFPVAPEKKSTLSRPVCWTAKLQTCVVANFELLSVSNKDRMHGQRTACATDYPLRLQFWRLQPCHSSVSDFPRLTESGLYEPASAAVFALLVSPAGGWRTNGSRQPPRAPWWYTELLLLSVYLAEFWGSAREGRKG
jgi:hypothetical protein